MGFEGTTTNTNRNGWTQVCKQEIIHSERRSYQTLTPPPESKRLRLMSEFASLYWVELTSLFCAMYVGIK